MTTRIRPRRPDDRRPLRFFDSGARSAALRVVFQSDRPGVVDELTSCTNIAVHVGTPVRMLCRHGEERHAGLAIHGDVDIIPEGLRARWEMKQTDTALVIGVAADCLRQVAEECGVASGVSIRSRFQIRDPQIEHIAWALKAEAEHNYPGGTLYLEHMGRALAVQLLRRHSAQMAERRPAASHRLSPREIREALAHIEGNLANDIRLQDIALAAGVSASHLEALFRRATGMPVHQYVIRRRVDQAVLLLKCSSLSITDIAFRTGFAHQSHLAMHVRRLLGVPPKYIRRFPGSAPSQPA